MRNCQRIALALCLLSALNVTVFASGPGVSAAASERSTQLNALGDVEGCDGDV